MVSAEEKADKVNSTRTWYVKMCNKYTSNVLIKIYKMVNWKNYKVNKINSSES